MKALIFGINGQDGHYLREILLKNKIEVIGVSRSAGDWLRGSVGDFNFVEDLVKSQKPDYIFHLAANSTWAHSALFENYETIGTGALNILEAVYRHSPGTKVFLSGSALQFENKGLPINESSDWSPSSPYAVARIQSVYAGRYYRGLGLAVYIGYFFHHDSPLRAERHMTQKIAQAVKRIAGGSQELLEIGDLDIKKEYNFAGDIAQAVWLLVNNNAQVYECVIGSGRAYSIREWLEICCRHYGLDWKKIVKIKENFIPDYQILVSDPKILFSLGWRPTVDIEKLSELMLK